MIVPVAVDVRDDNLIHAKVRRETMLQICHAARLFAEGVARGRAAAISC
jgi:hypothetical protein